PLAIDSWTMRDVANNPTIIRTTAPSRSDQGARLKKTHHTTIANPPTTPTITPKAAASGTTMGRPNLTNHCSITMTTPAHNRSGRTSVDLGTVMGYHTQEIWDCFHKSVVRHPRKSRAESRRPFGLVPMQQGRFEKADLRYSNLANPQKCVSLNARRSR